MKNRWIVIAHRAGAQLVAQDPEDKTLRLVTDADNPEGRLKNSEIDTDGPGKAFSSHGQGGGHPMGREEDAHDRAASDFARELAWILSAHRANGHFDELTLIAAPAFLGMLRGALDKPTAACVAHTLDKNLGHVDKLDDLIPYLEPLFQVHARQQRVTR